MQSVTAQPRSPAKFYGSISRNGARPVLQGPVGIISRASRLVHSHLQFPVRPAARRSAEPALQQTRAISPPAAAAPDAHADAGSLESMSVEGGFDQLHGFTQEPAGDNVLGAAASGGSHDRQVGAVPMSVRMKVCTPRFAVRTVRHQSSCVETHLPRARLPGLRECRGRVWRRWCAAPGQLKRWTTRAAAWTGVLSGTPWRSPRTYRKVTVSVSDQPAESAPACIG